MPFRATTSRFIPILAKIPCKFPVYQGIRAGAAFDPACAHRQLFSRIHSPSRNRAMKAPVIAGFRRPTSGLPSAANSGNPFSRRRFSEALDLGIVVRILQWADFPEFSAQPASVDFACAFGSRRLHSTTRALIRLDFLLSRYGIRQRIGPRNQDLFLLEAMTPEFQRAAILGHGADDIVGHAAWDVGFDFERDLH